MRGPGGLGEAQVGKLNQVLGSFWRQKCVCPWWFISVFDNPIRRCFHNPEWVLKGLVCPGDRALDLGCGRGYFTIPMARLAGATGSVTAVDIQARMLAGVQRRAERAGMLPRIQLHQADRSGLGVTGPFDVALAFWVVHEVADQAALFQQMGEALRPGGRLLMVEPKVHVTGTAFARSLAVARAAGWERMGGLQVSLSRAVLLRREERVGRGVPRNVERGQASRRCFQEPTGVWREPPNEGSRRGDRSAEREWWVTVCDQQEGIGSDAEAPAVDAHHEVEQTARIGSCEEDGEPGHDHAGQHADPEEP